MRILIVDDSSATRTFLREILESSSGFGTDVEVSEADGGLEALRLLPRGPYALVVSDINMSGINGLELLNFIRKSEQHAETPVLLISTQCSQKDRQRGLSLGANAYLGKPFTAGAFLEQVSALVEKDVSGG